MPKDNSKHQIQKLSFELGYDSEKDAYQFQSEFSAFIKERILPLTESIFEEFGSKKNIRIEKLTLDLGDIPKDRFKEEIYQKYESRLSDKLRLILNGYDINSPEEKPETVSLIKSQYEILLYFFQTGILPWNAVNTDSSSYINAQFIALLESTPAKAKQLIKSLLQEPAHRLRVIRQVNNEIYWKMIQVFQPEEVEGIKKWVFNFDYFYKQTRFLSVTEPEFKECYLEFILIQTLTKKDSAFNRESLTRLFIPFIADKYKVEISRLVASLLPIVGLKIEQRNGKNVLIDAKAKGKGKSTNASVASDSDLVSLLKGIILSNEDGFISLDTIPLSDLVEFRLDSSSLEVRRRNNLFSEEQRSYLNTLLLQRVSIISTAVKKYFSLPNKYRRPKSRKSIDLEFVTTALKDILSFNPSILKRIFQEIQFDLSSYPNQLFVFQLEPAFRKKFLFEVFAKEERDFIKQKELTEVLIVKEFLSNGFSSREISLIELEDIINSKKEFSGLVITVLKDSKVLKDIQKGLIRLSDEKKIASAVQQWIKYIEEPVISNYFNEQYKIYRKNSKSESEVQLSKAKYIEEVIGDKLYDSSASFEVLIQLFKRIAEDDKAELVKDNFQEIINKLIEKYESKTIAQLDKLTPAVYKKIQKYLKEEVKEKVEAYRKSIESEVQHLIKEKKKIEEFEEKIKELKTLQQKAEEAKEEVRQEIKLGEPVYIHNAGLVIVHPYLTMLFKKFELLNKKEFKDEYSMHKAVHILQYLANKSEKVEEHELVLNKILCGMDLSEPLRSDIELTIEEKEICESLLVALIENWSMLKKTSPDNLRSSFFIRNGRLLLESVGWKLRVEEKGYDILVEKLPWSIAMVKLPWMKNIIYVEWK